MIKYRIFELKNGTWTMHKIQYRPNAKLANTKQIVKPPRLSTKHTLFFQPACLFFQCIIQYDTRV